MHYVYRQRISSKPSKVSSIVAGQRPKIVVTLGPPGLKSLQTLLQTPSQVCKVADGERRNTMGLNDRIPGGYPGYPQHSSSPEPDTTDFIVKSMTSPSYSTGPSVIMPLVDDRPPLARIHRRDYDLPALQPPLVHTTKTAFEGFKCIPAKRKHRSSVASSSSVPSSSDSHRNMSSSSRNMSTTSDSSSSRSGGLVSGSDGATSVLDIIREHTGPRSPRKDEDDSSSKLLGMFADSLERGKNLVWKHRQNRMILPRAKKASQNVVEDLFNSELMGVIEWTTAEAWVPCPALPSLSSSEADAAAI